MKREKVTIGKGNFGKVFRVENTQGEDIALKITKPENFSLVEIDILSRVKSPYLIKSIGEIDDSICEPGIKLELKENNLTNLKTKKISHGQKKRIISSLLHGLECLHKSGFLHLDLKPSNCLYDSKNSIYTAYISDFGVSLRCNDPYIGIERKTKIGSLKYMPYEIFSNNSNKYFFNDKSDIWSLGVTILVFLGFRYSINFSAEESVLEKINKIKKFWDNVSIDSLISKTLEDTDFSEKDKLDLSELLSNMLQKDSEKRISSKNFESLRFYKNNSIKNFCYVSDPKEILYIPYSSTKVMRGIKNIDHFFSNRFPQAKVEIYFLTIEIFIRLMAITPMQISDQTLEETVQKAFITSMKYYREVISDIRKLRIFRELGYDIAKFLKGDIAPNRYFYSAKYAEDLVLAKEILFTNYNLVSLYSYLEISELFEYFRQNYNYSKDLKEKIKTFKDLEEYEKPGKNTTKAIENDRSIFSYKNLKYRTERYEENVPEIIKMRQIEEKFRYIFQIDNDKVIEIRDIFKFYNDNFYEKDLSISEMLIKKDVKKDYLNYCFISEDIFDNINISGDIEEKHIIFKSREGLYSLLVRSSEGKEIFHYFSSINENFDNYLKINEKDTVYLNIEKFESKSLCKISEICLLFLIYYNNVTVSNIYNIIYMEDETIKDILNFCTQLSN